MNIAPEMTPANIRQEIRLCEQDLAAEKRSLDALTDRRDLVIAYGRIRDLTDTLTFLQDRLKTAEAQEAEKVRVQAETRARRERERDEAIAEHAELDADFESVMQPLEQAVLNTLDRLEDIAMQRGRASAQHADALFELNGRQANWSDNGHLSTGNGWFSKATEHARSDVRRCLFELYAARRHLHGLLQLDGQDSGHRGVFGIAPRPQELTQPDPNDAFRAQVVAEYTAKNG